MGLPTRPELGAYDAIYTMIDRMSWMSGRRALIVIGSGFDSLSRTGQSDILRRLNSSGVIVFALGTLSEARRGLASNMSFDLELRRRQAFFERMADHSGGFARLPLTSELFVGSMGEILAAIDASYELLYTPDAAGTPGSHEITVKAFRVREDGSRSDLEVSVRESSRN